MSPRVGFSTFARLMGGATLLGRRPHSPQASPANHRDGRSITFGSVRIERVQIHPATVAAITACNRARPEAHFCTAPPRSRQSHCS